MNLRALLLAASLPFSSPDAEAGVAITNGCYLYSAPVAGESAATGPEAPAIEFKNGRLTDRDAAKAVHWPADKNAPLRMHVVLDLLGDTPLDNIRLHTRRANQHFRTDSVSVEYRAEGDASYRVALFAREGIKDPWDRIDLPMAGKNARYVRVTLVRRHVFVNTPLAEVEVTALRPPVKNAAGDGALAGEFARDALMVDRFGQFLYEEWPGKISTAADLARDRVAEEKRLAQADRSAARLDSCGGRLGGAPLKTTGFFRLDRLDGRWWLVTPEGNPYFMNGTGVTSYSEDGYSTSLTNKKGEPRGVFAELPDRASLGVAYGDLKGSPRVNFLTANLREKYGPDFHREWTEVMKKRLLDWGINANSKWTRAESLGLPYITVLRPAPETRRIKQAVDPFDPDFARNVEEGVARPLAAMRDDPLIIGHTFESEKGWDAAVFAAMLKLGDDSPAKAAFVDFLRGKYGDDEAMLRGLLGVADVSREALLRTPLEAGDALKDDAKAFILKASRRYYRIATEIIRRHDPNHLILGSSLTVGWHSSYEWEVGAIDHVDALSFDYYVSTADWIEPYLKYDKPILLLEYGFVVSGRGMPGFHSTVPSQRDRGLHYRHYIENLAAKPQFVGAGWFALYDQAITGRSAGGGGERYNFGFINQQDQPYEEMLAEVRKTSARLFDVHAGRLPPFQREDLAKP